MDHLEEDLLRFIAKEVFCSPDDLQSRIRTAGANPEADAEVAAGQLLALWEDRGWVETAEMDPGGLVSLTDKAFAELPWLQRP